MIKFDFNENNWFLLERLHYSCFISLYIIFSNYFNLSFFQIIALIHQIKNVSWVEIHRLSNNKYRWSLIKLFLILLFKISPKSFWRMIETFSRDNEWIRSKRTFDNFLISFPISFFFFLSFNICRIHLRSFLESFLSSIHFSNEKNIYIFISKKYRYRLTHFYLKIYFYSLPLSLSFSLQINPHEWFHSTFTSSVNTQLIQRCFYRDLYLYEGWLFPLDFSPPRIPLLKE